MLAIDSVNRAPAPNSLDVTKDLPPAPTEFNVAVVKPAEPDSKDSRFQLQPGGRFTAQNFPLVDLIRIAWDIDSYDKVPELPKWAQTARFEIVAKSDSFPAPIRR